MHWSKPLSALILFGLAVGVVGSLAALLLSTLFSQFGAALPVLAVVVLAVGAGALLGAGSTRRRENPYW